MLASGRNWRFRTPCRVRPLKLIKSQAKHGMPCAAAVCRTVVPRSAVVVLFARLDATVVSWNLFSVRLVVFEGPPQLLQRGELLCG